MPRPLLIFRIGWMVDYQGKDKISNGGSWIAEHDEGGEMWNFREEGGRCYGYVMTNNSAGIDLSRISPYKSWPKGSELSGVDVVFIARETEAGLGQVVVGWYKNANVFHKEYRKRRGSKKRGDWSNISYLCEVLSENATLLPKSKRTLQVPRGEGFPGQSNVWYENHENSSVVQFIKKLRKYITTDESVSFELPKKRIAKSTGGKPNKDEILAIERSAIEEIWAFFEGKGYNLLTVETDNAGWDLEAVRDDEHLLLEVKGHKGNVVQFELTPNEYSQLQQKKNTYRVCVVRNALTEPDLTVFVPQNIKGQWWLVETTKNEKIRLDEKVAAKAVQIGL